MPPPAWRQVIGGARMIVNTIVETIPDVSQFWKYDPKQFMASPSYSRDYPTAKNLE